MICLKVPFEFITKRTISYNVLVWSKCLCKNNPKELEAENVPETQTMRVSPGPPLFASQQVSKTVRSTVFRNQKKKKNQNYTHTCILYSYIQTYPVQDFLGLLVTP